MRSLRQDPGQLVRLAHRYGCPLCQHAGVFLSYSNFGPPRRNAQCPHCGSLERHRLVGLCLHRLGVKPGLADRIVHFAPEPVIARFLAGHPGYTSADLQPGAAREVQDITRMTYPDASMALFIANHVLEHVPDDAAAMKEIRRVLAPDGLAVLTVPLDEERATTEEDLNVTDPAERLRRFGHTDHVRIYGCDFTERLKAAGLRVQEFRASKREAKLYGVSPFDVVFLARPMSVANRREAEASRPTAREPAGVGL